jgi:hypothetical protein
MKCVAGHDDCEEERRLQGFTSEFSVNSKEKTDVLQLAAMIESQSFGRKMGRGRISDTTKNSLGRSSAGGREKDS